MASGHRQFGGGRLPRRTASVAATVAAFAVLVAGAPLLAPLALVADVLTGPRRLRHLRLYALVVLALAIELTGIAAATGLWVATGFGLLVHRPWSQRLHFRLQNWWVGALLRAAGVTVGLQVDVDDLSPATAAAAVVVARHTSIGDAIVPAGIFGSRLGQSPRYTLKHELMWVPCIDIVGHRLPHHFVDRTPDEGSAQLDSLRAIAGGVGPDSVAVILPEGTFFTEARQARVVEKLRGNGRVELAARAEKLRHLLPPRPAGTLALLDGAPTADVIVLGHVGFERFASLGAIYRSVPFREPVRVWMRRVPRGHVPLDPDERVRWLYDEWQRLDDEIDEHLRERRT